MFAADRVFNDPAGCAVCAYVTFDAVDANGPDDVWAAGDKRVQAPDGFVGTHLYVARWDGSEWTVMNTPLTTGGSGSNVRDIEIIAPDDIWFFGDLVSPGSGISALAMPVRHVGCRPADHRGRHPQLLRPPPARPTAQTSLGPIDERRKQ